MFLLTKPDEETVRRLIAAARAQSHSYAEVGASRLEPPAGYTVDHNRIRLGAGRDVFDRAILALNQWKMFDLGWCRIVPPEAPVEVGTTVGVLVSHFGFWSLNFSRVVYKLGERKHELETYGFAYGTLTAHAETGEERFMVEHHAGDDSVWYDLYAFSRPSHILARLGYPISRTLQKRFARDSLNAMKTAANL